MNFIKRGILSVSRTKKKSLILLLLVFLLGNVIIGAISIKQAVENTETNMIKQIGGVATLGIDTKNYGLDEVGNLTIDIINKIGNLEEIDTYDYQVKVGFESDIVKKYYKNQVDSGNNNINITNQFILTGVHNLDILDFKTAQSKLVDGRLFNNDDNKYGANTVLITKKFAETNKLSVGSKFIFDYSVTKGGDKVNNEFTVIGIYEPKELGKGEKSESFQQFLEDEQQNKIYTTEGTLKAIVKEGNEKILKEDPTAKTLELEGAVMPIYLLKDPLQIDEFKKEAEPMLPKGYVVSDSSESLKAIAAPMKNMGWIAGIVLNVAVGATLIILTLLITLFLRDRRHEIGIYLSLGEKRRNVIGQIIFEVVIVAIIGITLSLGTGSILSKSMSKTMMENQIMASEDSQDAVGNIDNLGAMGYGSNISKEDLAKSYEININATTVLLLCIVGLGTVIVSIIVPIGYITKLNPKKIMM